MSQLPKVLTRLTHTKYNIKTNLVTMGAVIHRRSSLHSCHHEKGCDVIEPGRSLLDEKILDSHPRFPLRINAIILISEAHLGQVSGSTSPDQVRDRLQGNTAAGFWGCSIPHAGAERP